MPKTQPNQHPPMTPDKAMASLAFATHLQNQFLQHQTESAQPTQTNQAPQNTQNPQPQKTTPNIRDEYPKDEKVEDEKLDMVLKEISSIKDEIKTIIEEDKNEDKKDGQEK